MTAEQQKQLETSLEERQLQLIIDYIEAQMIQNAYAVWVMRGAPK